MFYNPATAEQPGLYGIASYFPTPKALALAMVSKLPSFSESAVILEPSAGEGDLAEVIRESFPRNTILTIEKNPILSARLKFPVVGDDFLKYNDPVDIIIANPPFSNNYQDIDHVYHMWEILKPGGSMVSLTHYFSSFSDPYRVRYKPQRFQEWARSKKMMRRGITNAFVGSRKSSFVAVAMIWGTK